MTVLSPDRRLLAGLARDGFEVHELTTPSPSLNLWADRRSAVIFHDHEWETELLDQVLRTETFLVGAMGSAGTHAARLEALRAAGCRNAC